MFSRIDVLNHVRRNIDDIVIKVNAKFNKDKDVNDIEECCINIADIIYRNIKRSVECQQLAK